MSQDNDTPEDRLDVAYLIEGAFQLEAYEFGKSLIPFLKDESTATGGKFIVMLKNYDSYWDAQKNKLESVPQRRLQYVLLFSEAINHSGFLRDTQEVVDALSKELNAHFERQQLL
ncbi:uncharacterized protein TrAtP1_001377 [Trichoderma atroviride]|nr:hypothetical protein TrAtP1_001377 [Trichoderma atroviride]